MITNPDTTTAKDKQLHSTVQYPHYTVHEGWARKQLQKLLRKPFARLFSRPPIAAGSLTTTLPSQRFTLGQFTFDWQGADVDRCGLIIRYGDKSSQPIWQTPIDENFVGGTLVALEITENRGAVEMEEHHQAQFPNQSVEQIENVGETLEIKGNLEASARQSKIPYTLSFQLASPTVLSFELNIVGEDINQAILRFATTAEEHFYGFGEQFSYVDGKGHEIPIVCEEGGIGRSDPGPMTLNLLGVAGEVFASYAPMPYFLTNQGRALFLQNSEPSVFNLRDPEMVSVRVAASRLHGQLLTGQTPLELLEQFTERVGRMPPLPDWLNRGAIIGMQGGTERVRQTWAKLRELETPIAGFWLQDWVGQRKTVFGKQLWWNWQLDPNTYPGWDQLVADLSAAGITVGAYVNPFLVAPPADQLQGKRNLFGEAKEQGFLVKTASGEPYLVKNTDFSAGLVDLSNPAACEWFKAVIKDEMLGRGVKFWMADFAEAAQFDGEFASGELGLSYHNQYPVAWAALNREAIQEANQEGNAWFFNRAGYLQSPAYSTGMWLGDQNVTWHEHDGIASTVDGLLSSGLSGISLNHSDIGGYTSITNPLFRLFRVGFTRSRELLFRWMELNAFTPIFRTHEGNQPEVNAQFDTDDETLATFSRWAKVYAALADYRQQLMTEAATRGYPLVRHLVLHYPDDVNVYGLEKEFLLGPDFLIAPVLQPGATSVQVYLPAGEWVHLWTGQTYGSSSQGLWQEVSAPIGQPAVFYRPGADAVESAIATLKKQGLI